jgi:pimeloyl-[acyl-carrier protein] synthase
MAPSPQRRELDALLEGPAFYADPYPAFRRLREESPIHWHRASASWLIGRYDDAELVLRTPAQFSSYGFQNKYFESLRPELRAAAPTLELRGRTPTLITSDPPAHTRLRRLLQVVFTPKAIEALRPMVEAVVSELLDEAVHEPEVDMVSTLAFPLPAIMIAEIMGVPRDDRGLFKQASTDVVRFMNRANPNLELDLEYAEHADRSLSDFRDYLGGLIDDRLHAPREDIVSTLVHAELDGDRLESQEILWNLVLFLIAGHETTTNLIANGINLLLHHADQFARLQEDAALLPAAIDEMLRFESPVQRVRRVLATDVEIGDRRMRAGEPVEVLIGCANRDPSRWDASDRFDIVREPVAHIAFGKGVHFCIGASLARMEATVALGQVLERFPGMRMVPDWEPEWMHVTNLRTLKRLPVELAQTGRVAIDV